MVSSEPLGGSPRFLDPSASQERRRDLSGGMLALDIEDILAILPQRPPLLMIDQVMTLVPRQHGVGVKAVTGNEGGLARHRTGFVFPSTFALEAMVQLANVVLLFGQEAPPEQPPTVTFQLDTVHSMEVEQEMATGDRIYLTVSVGPQTTKDRYRIVGSAELSGEKFVAAEFDVVRSGLSP